MTKFDDSNEILRYSRFRKRCVRAVCIDDDEGNHSLDDRVMIRNYEIPSA